MKHFMTGQPLIGHRPRRAFTLIEMTIAATLLGVVFAVLGQFLVRWEAARRAADDRTFALQTLECILERVAAGQADDLLPTGTGLRLRSPEFELVQTPPDDANLTAVTGRLTWQNAEGQRVTPVVLTTWNSSSSPRSGGSP